MAYINDMYIHVVDEDLSDEVELSSHSVENGIDVTDTIQNKPYKLSLSGEVVDYDIGEGDNLTTVKANDVLTKLKEIKRKGALVHYLGRNDVDNLQIASIHTSHPNTIVGGAKIELELQQFRIANNSYPDPVANIRRTFVTGAPTEEQKAAYEAGTSLVEEWWGLVDSQAVAFDGAENLYAIRYKVQTGDNLWNLLCADNAPFKNLLRPTIYQVQETVNEETKITYTLTPNNREVINYWTNENPLAYVASYPPNEACFDTLGDGATLRGYEWLFVGFMEKAWL